MYYRYRFIRLTNFIIKNNKVIGVHNSGYKHNNNCNFGILLIQPIKEYIKKYEKNNSITAQIDIRVEDINKPIQIINSFERAKANKIILYLKSKDYDKYINEKEIKNCKIRINKKNIDFRYINYFTR